MDPSWTMFEQYRYTARMPDDEQLDLVDEHDKVIGSKSREEIYDEGLNNYRVVNAFIINSQGKLWIPRRVATKKRFPLGLDMSLGGHVTAGETYEQSFRRELQEELRIDNKKVEYRLLGQLTPHEDGVSSFMNVYEITLDEEPDYNREDFAEAYWFEPRELLKVLEAEENSKDDLPRLVKKFYIKE